MGDHGEFPNYLAVVFTLGGAEIQPCVRPRQVPLAALLCAAGNFCGVSFWSDDTVATTGDPIDTGRDSVRFAGYPERGWDA
jgi:hypothetical protein